MPVVCPKRPQSFLARTPVASAVLLALASPSVLAQDTTALGEVIVTAQKRAESLQDVPISIEALGEEKTGGTERPELQGLRAVPAERDIAAVRRRAVPASAPVYMRGVATGGDGQATTSQPSVGMYLDEQPITTIQGNLDVHLYDIERVEALAGPQGTLYGASSQAGTIRIITNKPDPSGFAAGYALEGNYVDMDDPGYVAEGFVNLPMGENAAHPPRRLVHEHEAGWIDNNAATRTLRGRSVDRPTTTSRRPTRQSSRTTTTRRHGRRARGAAHQPRRELDGHAAAHVPEDGPGRLLGRRPATTSMADRLGPGGGALPRGVRERRVVPGGPDDRGLDRRLDVVYSGNYLDRDLDGQSDYSDYSYWYDISYTTGYFTRLFLDNDGNQLNPDAAFSNDDNYTKTSHEIRDHHAAGQARARPARLLLPEAGARLLPGVRPDRGARGRSRDERQRAGRRRTVSRATCT